jgi:CHAT domain-containing protein
VRFVPLPGTAAEGEQVLKILNLDSDRLLVGAKATKSALMKAAGPRILHVATHGYFLSDPERVQPAPVLSMSVEHKAAVPITANSLLRSGLALAGANRSQSGLLTALEAASLDLWGTQLVVLSACDSGVGDVHNGEGVYGLRRALVMAGSRSQVMTLWKIDDDATRGFMASYYRRLAKGEGRAAALQAVQRETLNIEEHHHPYFWASFINSGDSGPLGQ